jgi:hypothetical protein
VLPVIVFTMVVLSTMMVAAMLTADDENRAARAMRESSEAFYAAEAGLHAVFADWDSVKDSVNLLEPGTSYSLEWRTLDSGGKFKATIHRWDNNGTQPVYQLEVEGRGRGARAGQRTLSLALTSGPGGPGTGYSIGECCEGAVTVRGAVDLEDDTGIDGHDTHPPGWGEACEGRPLEDKPGLIMKDTTLIRREASTWMDGEPPLVQDPTLSDAAWDQFGDLSWVELKDQATKLFDDGTFSPNPSTKVVDGQTVCNTDDPNNLGSPDPNHPCFDYFPIVVINDDVTFQNGYAQGIFVLEWDESTKAGSEFDLEANLTVNGVILGKGCVEPEENSRFYGAIFVDAEYRNYDICNSDYDYDMNDGDATVRWSQCAVDRAIVHAGLDEWAEVKNPGGSGGIQLLGHRAFGELLR